MSQIDEHESWPFEQGEKLGRDERSRTSARRSFRRLKLEGEARVPASKFEPLKNTNDISVNRMDLAPAVTLAELGVRDAGLISKQFWGWYKLTVGDVEKVGCRVFSTPLNDTPYRADIAVPVALDAEDRKDALREYAIGLAYSATFVPWGEWTNELI